MKRGVGIFAGLLLFFTFSYATDLDVVPSDLVSTPGFVILADAVARRTPLRRFLVSRLMI